MLVLGMLGAAAAQNQVQGALQGQNNGQPVHIEAMTLEIRDKDKTATFSGNVKVVQGDTTMRCRTLVVFYGPEEGAGATKAAAAPTSTESQAAPGMPQGGSIRRAEARGDVTVVSKDQNASGDLGVYDMKKKTITLTGNVVVSQGKNVLHGERVVVDTVTGDARIDSGVTAHDGVESGSPLMTGSGCSLCPVRTPRAPRRTPCPSRRRAIRIDWRVVGATPLAISPQTPGPEHTRIVMD